MNNKRIVVVFLFVIVGIPVIVNAIGCPELLSYYGSLIGAIIAIVAILFTREQIQRESFLKNEMDKWTRLKSIFLQILDNINPMNALKDDIDNGMVNPVKAISSFQKYQLDCKMANDLLSAHLSDIDYPKFEKLLNDITALGEECADQIGKLIEEYSACKKLLDKKKVEDALRIEEEFPGSFSKESIDYCKSVEKISKTTDFYRIDERITQLKIELAHAYEDKYRVLLQRVGAKFHELEADTQRQADSMLVFGNIFSSNTCGNQKRTDNHK